KATMNFAGFLTTSAASGALLESTIPVLERGALLAKRAGQKAIANRLLWLSKTPKFPAVQFAVALLVMFGLASYLDKFTSWIDEKIPDGGGKRAANDAIGVLSGSSAIESAAFFGKELGVLETDPEREAYSYLSQELLSMGWSGLQQRKVNGIADWNRLVSRAIENEENPLMQQLYGLERASTGSWAQKQSFELYSEYMHAREFQQNIGQELVERGVLQNAHTFDLLFSATSQDSAERPDWAVKRMEDDTNTHVGRAIAYLKKLGEDDALSQAWQQYRAVVKHVAERVTTYRHLNIYQRNEWLGSPDQKGMPGMVQKGIAAEISYQLTRSDILRYRAESGYSRGAFMELVTDVEERHAFRDVPEKLKLANEQPWPDILTDPKGFLKRLRQHNSISENTADEMDRHFLEIMLGRMGAEAIQHENAHKFRQGSESLLHECQKEPRTAVMALPLVYLDTLPDSVLLQGKWTSDRWKTAYDDLDAKLQKEEDPRMRALMCKNMLELFLDDQGRGAAGVPMLRHSHKFRDELIISGGVKCHYKPEQKQWYVSTDAHVDMPYIAVSGLGSKHHFPKLNVQKLQRFADWKKEHPDIAKDITPQLVWHEKWVRTLQERLTKEQEAARQREGQEKQKELSEADTRREQAKKYPETWQPYAAERNGEYYEYVAYDPDRRAFVYLSTPKLEKKTYVKAPGTVVPSTGTQTGMRVELEDGRWFKWDALHGDFVKSIETKYNPAFASAIRKALSFPRQNKESFDSTESARVTLLTILATYARGEKLKEQEWTALIDETINDTAQLRTAERSREFFANLVSQINGETLVSKMWQKGTQRHYLSPDMYRRALAKTRSALQLES
ncbi:MAG: hypothetical protein PHO92_05505, partial [Candidatus Peribacteraceae bacterium]|nr:hypothetical protein [Candidatus Peribacteraceae bacterium]